MGLLMRNFNILGGSLKSLIFRGDLRKTNMGRISFSVKRGGLDSSQIWGRGLGRKRGCDTPMHTMLKYSIWHVISQDHVMQGSYNFMIRSSLLYATTLPSLVAIGIAVAEILCL